MIKKGHQRFFWPPTPRRRRPKLTGAPPPT